MPHSFTARRREFLRGALALAVTPWSAAPRPARAAPGADATAPLPPILRPIPSSGERLPAVGLGSAGFRASLAEDIRAEIRRMSQLGGTVIDTAAAYGDSAPAAART